MTTKYAIAAVLCTALAAAQMANAAVSAEEASKLGTTLTPLGAEKAANKDGTIPSWTGGDQKVPPGFKGTARRPDPFANEKPLYSITGQNYSNYADKLSDGQVAMLRKYPDYRIDVYPTHRTASAPQWVYENTLKNAQTAATSNDGYSIKDAYGGIPFPIPKTGVEAMWNHLLAWKGEAWRYPFNVYVTASDGKRFLVGDNQMDEQSPYYFKDGAKGDHRTEYDLIHLTENGPPQHAGEALVSRDPLDQVGVGTQVWQYLTGQRRVRKLPNAKYDTPSAFVSGVSNYDEFYNFRGPMDLYEWTLVGKKEMFIPYNNNGFYQPTHDADVLSQHFANPDHVRWELHRVWVVEAKLASGKRHVMPKRRFYLDEDTWLAQLADGWDAGGKLWKTFVMLNVDCPDLPGVVAGSFMAYNVQTSEWVANDIFNEKSYTIYFPEKPWPDTHFTGDALATEGVR